LFQYSKITFNLYPMDYFFCLFAENELFCGINGKLKEIIILKEICEIKS